MVAPDSLVAPGDVLLVQPGHLAEVVVPSPLPPQSSQASCASGAEKIAHGLRGCMDENWQVEGFTVLKIDIVNAFNLVSRQALLSECSTHFPELLPWVSWCYSRHPVLWHTLGNLTSQSGVQQGDPLGPLLFSLVLNVVVKAIATHPECGDLLYHVWYHDDGVLAGPSSYVRKALSLLIELSPPLGLHVNIIMSRYCPQDYF